MHCIVGLCLWLPPRHSPPTASARPRAGAVSCKPVASESPSDFSTSAIGSGSRSALTQPMGRFAESPGQRFVGAMKIIQHADCFEVRSEDGSIVRKFAFDDNARRRAISRRMTRKQAFQAARTFAGKSYTVETAKP